MEGLKLKGMAECYKALQGMPVNQWPTLDTFMARLAEAEQQYRNRKRTEMYLYDKHIIMQSSVARMHANGLAL